MNYEHNLNPWDIITTGVLFNGTAEHTQLKNQMRLYKRGITQANFQGYQYFVRDTFPGTFCVDRCKKMIKKQTNSRKFDQHSYLGMP